MIELVTYEWFSERYCHKKFDKNVNSFNKTSRNWTSELVAPKKFNNLHKCLIVIETGPFYYPNIGDKKLTGFLFELSEIVAQQNNFLIHRQPEKAFIEYFKPKAYFDPDLKIYTDSIMGIINENFHMTTAFGETVNNFMISSAESYSSYEKMLLPFDKATWCMITITFSTAFLTILALNQMPKAMQIIIYGNKVTMPILNVIRIFFGIPQLELPSYVFSRIILIFFVYYCLVIRTAYQGVFYEMLTSDMKKELPTTIEELFRKNYTIYMRKATSASSHLTETIKATRG